VIKLLFLLLSGAKFAKLLTTGGTMLLSIGVYALLYGWRYAVGFVLLLFVHELGHYLAARQRGLPVGAPTARKRSSTTPPAPARGWSTASTTSA
jgi:Zn-dependent protease